MKYGLLTVIEEIEPIIYIAPSGKKHKKRQIKCLCECGNTTVKERSQLTTGKTKSCGCNRYSGIGIKTHGLSGVTGKRHKLYSVWASQKSRCNNPNDKAYRDYGEKGVIFSSDLSDFSVWLRYVLSLDNAMKEKFSIDRSDNNKGYEKGNLRWVNRTIQQCNRGKTRTNKAGYKGIWTMSNGRFRARVQYKKKGYHIGVYPTAKDAAIAYNNYVISHILPHSLNKIG